MLVQKVVAPGGETSWTVVDERFEPVEPVEVYLAHLEAIERSPNTLRAYASSLRLFFDFLEGRGVAWEEVRLEEVGRFVSWLRRPTAEVVVPIDSAPARATTTVNRHLAAVFGLYEFHARRGLSVASELVDWRRGGRGSYKPFLEGVGGRSRKSPRRPVRLRTPRRLPETLSPEQITSLLAACEHLRDRLLVALIAETGMRIGQALGLRHSDVVSRDKTIRIVPRSGNANGARAKCRDEATIPVSAALVRLYSEYLFDECGDIDSDYVFVNLFAAPIGRPLRYSAVTGLVGRLRARTGIEFSLHLLRHSAASEWVRSGVPIEVVSKLLTHANVTTTSGTYVHLGVEDLRAELEKAGLR
ncbi:MAG: tyrosine-type recombinase/integrase [Actinomycetota bacterium]|nr:tyrosine-type recombinase/integrase [Actinomycetota bacterium]